MCAKKKCKPKPFCYAFPCPVPTPIFTPTPTPYPPVYNAINNSLCGNILLNDLVTTLEIWKAEISGKATVTISVFNSSINTSSIKIIITRNIGNSVEFTVPPGNTLSATIDNAKSITISREDTGIVEGKYCLKVNLITA